MTDEDIWSVPCHAALMRDKPAQLAIDSETSGLTWVDKAFGVSFAWYVDDELRSGYIDMRTHPELWDEVKAWIKDAQPVLLLWNSKFDFHKLGIYPQPDRYEDGCLMTYVVNEQYPKGLKVLAKRVLKEETDEAEVLKETRRKLKLTTADGYDKLPMSVVAPYAIQDAIYTLKLCLRLQVAIEAEEDLKEVYSVEKALTLCVAGTERKGMKIDVEYVKGKIIELGDTLISLEREIAEIVGRPVGEGKKIRVPDGKYKNGRPKFKLEETAEFNPNSPTQILSFLQAQGEDITATDKESLGKVTHPLGPALLILRSTSKLRATYLMPMVSESVEGILHPSFNLTATKTKRFSSSGEKD